MRICDTTKIRSWDRVALFIVLALLAYLIIVWLHLFNLSSWRSPDMNMGGELIMGTHDAYYWLAGAKGIGRAVGEPLALMAKYGSALTGAPLTNFGVYTAPLLASLTAVIMILWAWSLGALEAGITAAVVASLGPGFFMRSRLGYYDTDIFTMVLPLLFSCLLAWWLAPYVSWRNFPPLAKWLAGRSKIDPAADITEREAEKSCREPGLYLPLIAGGFVQLGYWFHVQIGTYGLICFVISMGFILLLAPSSALIKTRLLWGAIVFALAGQGGIFGLIVAIALTVVVIIKPLMARRYIERFVFPLAISVCLLIVLVLVGLAHPGLWQGFWHGLLLPYLKPLSQNTSMAGAVFSNVIYPGITQSVIEAQNVGLSEVLARIYPINWICAVGFIMFAVLIVFRPTALFLLPLALLGLLSFKLGSRTSMFGSPPLALGIAVLCNMGLAWLCSKWAWKRTACLVLQLALIVLLIFPYINLYPNLYPKGVLAPFHIKALKSLSVISPPNSRVWSWWDWGYPIQYYAERLSFADGEEHGGEYVFPLGLVMVTPSFKQSAQVIKYAAMHNYQPWLQWDKDGADKTVALLKDLGISDLPGKPAEKQYVSISVEDLPLYPWISFYGQWDIKNGTSSHAYANRISGQFSLDEQAGVITINNEPPTALSTIDILSSVGRQQLIFPENKDGRHLLVLQEPGQPADMNNLYILDDVVYWSAFVQLLISDPEDERFKQYFKPVYNGAPYIRIYEVL